ncbi:MAG: TonB-dependent receptor, partial [Candidatus Eremiobacteraeota bacterium]|nr:TonB-dependent receptor [Candidatus Eremiobacteraeota bacterium]
MDRTRMAVAALALAVSLLLSGIPAFAQGGGTGTVTGTVVDAQGGAVSGAALALVGPSTANTTSGPTGSFTFSNVAAGLYTLSATRAGFVTTSRDDVTVIAGQTTTVSVSLVPTSFSSLREIGRVAVTGRGTINLAPASVATIPEQTFVDQGQNQVAKVLNQTPGVVATYGGGAVNGEINGATQGALFVPQVRGSLPYETQTLIDGHPVSIGFTGFYGGQTIDPHLLETVEVVKGPGVIADNINYAINGSVNFRTLEPTRKPAASFDLGIDRWGGQFSNYRFTGTT